MNKLYAGNLNSMAAPAQNSFSNRNSDLFRISALGFRISLFALLLATSTAARGGVIYEVTSPYHHIRVLEEAGLRTLCFDDALESRMSVQNPLQGHFEYTEYFQMAWLWNTNITSVAMVGLGGASTQRAFEYYFPNVSIETAEIDPMVLQVAQQFFNFHQSDRQKVELSDGRLFLRRNTTRRDLIILDAYVQGRYGSAIPQHLATKEFFELVRDRLTTNGIVEYNVIGSLTSWHAEIVGAIYHTLQEVFPQVYVFPALGSQNIVLLATRARFRADLNGLRQRAALLVQTGRLTMPGFVARLQRLQSTPPPSALHSPILTDDYAPVEGLSGGGGESAK